MKRILALLCVFCAGCVPALTMRVDKVEVPRTIVTSCVRLADIPPVPPVRIPPDGNVAALAAGSSADVRELVIYATQLRAILLACAKE